MSRDDDVEGKLAKIVSKLEAIERKMECSVMAPRAVRRAEAARLLGCSVKTVQRLIARGELRTVTIGSDRMVPMVEIIRKTSVTTPPGKPMAGPLPGRLDMASEEEKILTALRKRR